MNKRRKKLKKIIFFVFAILVLMMGPSASAKVANTLIDSPNNISTVTDTGENRKVNYGYSDMRNAIDSLWIGDQPQWVSNTDREGNQFLQVASDKSQQFGYGVLRKTIDAKNDFQIKGYFNPDRLTNNGASNGGDWLGLVMLPVNPSSLTIITDGGALGMQGVQNALGIGLDMYRNNNYNDPSDGPFGAMRWTDGNGNLQGFGNMNNLYTSAQNLTTWNSMVQYEFFYHYNNGTPYITGYLADASNTAGAGDRYWNFDTRNAGNGTSLPITVPSSGFYTVVLNGANGQNHQTMRSNMTIGNMTLYAPKVSVYYREEANQNTDVAPSTSFVSSTGNKIGITGFTPGAKNGTNNYNYDGSVPATAATKYKTGWHLSRTVAWNNNNAQDLTVLNDSTKNTYTLFYAPDVQQANVVSDSSDPTGAKTIDSIKGTSNGAMSGWTKTDSDLARTGYNYTVSYAGTKYATLAAAQAAVTSYDSTSNGASSTDTVPQTFTVTYTKAFQQAKVDSVLNSDNVTRTNIATYDTNTTPDKPLEDGTTGNLKANVNDAALVKPGYSYTVTAPNGTTYPTMQQAWTATNTWDTTNNPAGSTTDSSPQVWTVNYTGQKQTALLDKTSLDGKIADGNIESVNGAGGSAINFTNKDSNLTVTDYTYVVKVYDGDGTLLGTYTTLANAMIAYPNFDSTDHSATPDTDTKQQRYLVEYTPVKAFVNYNYVDENGNTIKSPTSSKQNTGADIDTSASTQPTISGYVYDRIDTTKSDADMKVDPTGMSKVVYVYKIDPTITSAANDAISNANSSNVKNEASVQDATKNLQDTLSNKTATAQEIEDATTALNNAVSQAQTDRQAAIDAANSAKSNTSPVSNEQKTKDEINALNAKLADSNATTEDINAATDALNSVVATDKDNRQTAIDSANQNITMAQNNATDSQDPNVQSAISNLQTVMANAANDESTALTQDIIDATTALNDAMSSSDAARTQAVTDANNLLTHTSPVSYETDVASAITNLKTVLANDSSTGTQIDDATAQLQSALDAANTARDTANSDGVTASNSAESSSVKNEQSVVDAYNKLQNTMQQANTDDENNLTSNIIADTNALNAAITQAQADRSQAQTDAQTAIDNADNSTVKNEQNVINEESNLKAVLADSNATTQQIEDATTALNNAVSQAQTDRQDAIDAANQAKTTASNSPADPSITSAQDNLNDVMNNPNSTTQDIKDATNALNDVTDQVNTTRSDSVQKADDAKDPSKTAPVTNEPSVVQAINNLNDLIQDSTSTAQQIDDATAALNNAVKDAKTERNSAKEAANNEIGVVNASETAQEPSVVAAKNALQDTLTKADADDPAGTTQAIKDAQQALQDAQQDATSTRTDAQKSINDANNSGVANEPSVQDKETDLKNILADPTSSNQAIKDAQQALDDAVTQAMVDYNAKKAEVQQALDDAKASAVRNEPNVQKQIDNTQAILDNPASSMADLDSAESALNDAVTQANTDRDNAKAAAQQAQTDVNNSTVANEPAVISANDKVTEVLNDPNSTTEDITNATTSLNDALAKANADRQAAKDNANQAISDTDGSQVKNEDSVSNAEDNLNTVINDPNSTTKDITDATTALNDAVTAANTARENAKKDAQQAITNSNQSSQSSNSDVNTARDNLNDFLNNPNSTTEDINNATDDLNAKVESAEKSDAIDKANQALDPSNTSPVSNEPEVVKASDNLNNLINDPNSTAKQITDATTALNDAVETAKAKRNDVIKDCNDLINNSSDSEVANDPSVASDIEELQGLITESQANDPDALTQDLIAAQQALANATKAAQDARDKAKDAIKRANDLNSNDLGLQSAVDNLKDILANPNSTTDDIKKATNQVNKIVDSLIAKQKKGKKTKLPGTGDSTLYEVELVTITAIIMGALLMGTKIRRRHDNY